MRPQKAGVVFASTEPEVLGVRGDLWLRVSSFRVLGRRALRFGV